MLTKLDKRTLQSQLWLAQYNLSKCTDSEMRDTYMLYIRELASELLCRYRKSKMD